MIRQHIAKIILSFLWLIFTNSAAADICNISNGSGIGGTGAVAYIGHNGMGGTGKPVQKNQDKKTTKPLLFNNGIGGTGAIAKEGTGIGGTGAVANGNSGIGGTGSPIQRVGHIVGTITGFGSICVNGIEIHYSSDTAIQSGGQHINPENAFAIGQVVSANVIGSGNEVIAKNIQVLHSVVGPVSSINIASNRLEILGQSVLLPTTLGSGKSITTIHTGNYIKVSGLRDPNGNIIASRLDNVKATSPISVRGPVTQASATQFKIEGLTINAKLPKGVNVGQELSVQGTVQQDQLTPDIISSSSLGSNVAKISGESISIEGYVTNKNAVESFEVSGHMVDIPKSLQDEASAIVDGQRIIVVGQLGEENEIILDNALLLEQVEINDRTISQGDSEYKESRDDDALEHKDSEHEALEFEDHEYEAPEAPEYEAPEVPEYEAPEVPEYEAPEVPEYEAPEVPEYEAPEVPEYEAPEVPDYGENEH